MIHFLVYGLREQSSVTSQSLLFSAVKSRLYTTGSRGALFRVPCKEGSVTAKGDTGLPVYNWGLSAFSKCIIWLNEETIRSNRAFFVGIYVLLFVLIAISPCGAVM